ncbi:hypothetical protein [Tautonia sociabilis]|uniref:Uncharacterized protein n=1 Tax=Tautonia sociabilis TaxID=2080755 RepID=A0A432MES0_9BACT|nr:hypothetical protein [Tautonia sociabilis]RUL84184.1 hypothetical protein TsocGM_20885 [Tautonia sociabilis]
MRRASSRPPRPGRPGLALVAVLAHLTLIFMAWSLANRQCASTIGLEEAIERRQSRQAGSLSALALGVALLETGTPDPAKLSGSPPTYKCFVEVIVDGAVTPYTLTFVELDPSVSSSPPTSRWSVSAAPYDAEEDIGIEGPITSF